MSRLVSWIAGIVVVLVLLVAVPSCSYYREH